MLTFFLIPKGFDKHFSKIQLNCIKSCMSLRPKSQIILIGDEEGIEKTAKKLKVDFSNKASKSKFGTPLVRRIFRTASKVATFKNICFINSDIIIDPNIYNVFKIINNKFNNFLIISRRWNYKLNYLINFEDPSWHNKLKTKVTKYGQLYPKTGIDLFIFQKGFFDNIPNFSIGHSNIDNWMLYFAKSKNIPIIDITSAIVLIHQQHRLKRNPDNSIGHGGPESKANLRLAGGYSHIYSTQDADYIVDKKLNICQNSTPIYTKLTTNVKRGLHKVLDKYFYY